MNDWSQVETILDRFREWLEDARQESEAENEQGFASAPALPSSSPPPPREFGIIDLIEEFTALRHELKLQTKSGRSLVDQTETVVAALKRASDHLRAVDAKESQVAWSTGKALAEALADLDEALVRGEREIERARAHVADESPRILEESLTKLFRKRPWIKRQFLRSFYHDAIAAIRQDARTRHELFDSFLEGYRLIQKRLRRTLAFEQIVHIPCEGNPVDPAVMTVIEVVDGPRSAAGTVLKELRRGYTWRGRLIRFAEVQAIRGSMGREDEIDDDPDRSEIDPDDLDGEDEDQNENADENEDSDSDRDEDSDENRTEPEPVQFR